MATILYEDARVLMELYRKEASVFDGKVSEREKYNLHQFSFQERSLIVGLIRDINPKSTQVKSNNPENPACVRAFDFDRMFQERYGRIGQMLKKELALGWWGRFCSWFWTKNSVAKKIAQFAESFFKELIDKPEIKKFLDEKRAQMESERLQKQLARHQKKTSKSEADAAGAKPFSPNSPPPLPPRRLLSDPPRNGVVSPPPPPLPPRPSLDATRVMKPHLFGRLFKRVPSNS